MGNIINDGTLHTLTDSGKPPESRVSDASEAKSIVENMILADRNYRVWKRSRVKGLIDGNPPYSSAEQRKEGRGAEPNVNFGVARSYLEAALSAFYDIFSEAPTYANAKSYYGANDDQTQEHEGIITEEFHLLQCKEESFRYNMQISQHEMVLYGCGPMMFYDTLDFRSEAILCGNLKMPEHSKSNNQRWELAVPLQTCAPHELYSYIHSPETASKMGWNVSYVRKAIMNAYPRDTASSNVSDWEWHQQKLKNGSFSYSDQSKVIRLAHVIFREFPEDGAIDGKISHKIILLDSMIENKEEEFLFEKVGRFENWNEIIHPMYYDHGGGGDHHSVTGMGIKLFSAMELQNRMLCKLAGDVFLPKTLFKPTTAANKQKMSVAHFGSYGIMPADFELQQNPVSGYMQEAIGFNRELSGIVASNLSQYRQNLEQKSGNPITASESDYRASQQSKLGKTQLDRYYDQLDAFYAEKYKRAINPKLTKSSPGGIQALEFQKRCMDRGVPRQAMERMIVRATRIVGSGSSYERKESLAFLLGMASMLPETGRENLIKAIISSRAGYCSVQEFYPETPGQETPTQQNVIAMLQVSSMHDGVPPVVESSQNPVIFAQTFLQAGAQALASLQQGGDPQEVLRFLDLVGPAIAAHIQRMSGDQTRTQVVKTLTEQWKQLGQQTDQLKQMLQKQAEQQQKQQQEAMAAQQQAQAIQGGTDPKVMIDQAMAQHKMKLDEIKTQAGLRHKEEKAQQAAKTSAQGRAIDDLEAANKIRIDRAKAAASHTNGE